LFTSRAFNSVPGSATWFFRDCIVKSVERCGGFVEGATLDFTEQTDSGRDGLTGLGMCLPSLGSTIVQKLEMYFDLLNTVINGHMRVPKEFPKKGLYEFVAEMRHMILINRLPPTELGDKLIAIGFEELSKPSEGSPNAPTHKWTEVEDRRILLNAQLAIGNKWNEIVLHLPGRTPLDVCNHWKELNKLPKLSNPLHKWTEDEDRIILVKHLSTGNNWSEENLIPGRTGIQIQSRWTNLKKQVAVYVYEKNIGGVHTIFNVNTNRFLLDSDDDVEQCLIALRMHTFSKEISDAVNVLLASNGRRHKWTEDEDRIILEKHLSTGNNWSEENLIPGRTGKQIQSHWTNLKKQVAVYVYEKNIGGVHTIFNVNTKKFLLDSDDVEQCLIALRTQSFSKEISDAVNVLLSNAKKRPQSSELGNATKKKKVATKNQTAKNQTVPKKSST
jgi:hypothetical protein